MYFNIYLCFLFFNFTFVIAYKAGALHSSRDVLSRISEAGTQELDILVLPDIKGSENNYDEAVKNLSTAAKSANAYVVANLKENIHCQNKIEIIRSTLVFDKDGTVISDYRKPINEIANCTAPNNGLSTFTTDFGVKFGLLMEDDIVLKKDLGRLKNFIVAGDWTSDLKVFRTPQYLSSWAYINNVNLITTHGIYPKTADVSFNGLYVADLMENGNEISKNPPIIEVTNTPTEDLSLYTIKPLDLEASSKGYKETICHDGFCCEFYVKTKYVNEDISYGLGVFNGVRHYSDDQYIGEQNCGVFPCAGVNKRSCDSSKNHFEILSINANYTKTSSQYPVVFASGLSTDSFHFATETDSNNKHVVAELTGVQNVMTFGIYGRNFEKDHKSLTVQNKDGVSVYDYFYNDDVLEFFDYLWIRVRILLLVVSIYVLEML